MNNITVRGNRHAKNKCKEISLDIWYWSIWSLAHLLLICNLNDIIIWLSFQHSVTHWSFTNYNSILHSVTHWSFTINTISVQQITCTSINRGFPNARPRVVLNHAPSQYHSRVIRTRPELWTKPRLLPGLAIFSRSGPANAWKNPGPDNSAVIPAGKISRFCRDISQDFPRYLKILLHKCRKNAEEAKIRTNFDRFWATKKLTKIPTRQSDRVTYSDLSRFNPAPEIRFNFSPHNPS